MNDNYCNNCGKTGHVFHQCKVPITSIGIITVNPKKTSAWFFYDTFKNSELIKRSKFEKKDNNLIIYQ